MQSMQFVGQNKICMVSIDVEEDVGSGGRKTFLGAENLDSILEIFEAFQIKATLFVTGEVLKIYPNLIDEWAKVHEIACHGYYHVPLYELSIPECKKQLRDFYQLYERILGEKPEGFRAVQHMIDNAQLKLLEELGFKYDSSVVPRYVPIRKYVGFKGKAPTEPYYPSYDNYRQKGNMKILEIPVTPLIFGVPLYGTWIRVFGPSFYKFLLIWEKPKFISLAMHPWDLVEYKGSFSRNSGGNFLPILKELLSNLKSHGYIFVSGSKLVNTYISQKM